MNNTMLTEHLISHNLAKLNKKAKTVSQGKALLDRFIKIITFVDLPIKKKFLLFSLGVLFWFVVMFVISIGANIDINNKTSRIVNHVVPLDRTIQKITRKLQSLNMDASEIASLTSLQEVEKRLSLSKTRIVDIRSFISALMLGGQVADINRDSSKLIDSFTIPPLSSDIQSSVFTKDLLKLVKKSEAALSAIAVLKTSTLHGKSSDYEPLDTALHDYNALLISALDLTEHFSTTLSTLYATNSGKIELATKITFFTFIGVLVLATGLLVIFTISISDSIIIPVQSIIMQIRALGAGKVDLTNQIEVRSKDEIGLLSADFNKLTREIHDIVTFKKVIEEDHSLEDVYVRLGQAFTEKCDLNEFTIYEVSNNSNTMKPVYPLVLNDREISCNEEILTNCDICKVKKTGHTISSLTYKHICKEFKPDSGKVHLCIPMIIGGRTGGVVQFRFKNDEQTEKLIFKRLFRAEQYIKESLSVIEAKRLTNTLRESALKDALTGLYNRRFLQEYTETLVSGVLRREKTVGLIMCDLDYFKQVNDTHGHNVGDAVLKETSTLIQQSVRSADLVIRFGGEEFLVLLLDVGPGETEKVAEKIRTTFVQAKIKIPEGTIQKTISLGISEFPVDTESFWQSIKFADVALYKAKESGRNKALRFDKEMWSGQEF